MLYIVLKAFEGLKAKEFFEESKKTFPEDELTKLFYYTSAFLENSGNFKSFGDCKFVPECSKETFVKFWTSTPYWGKHPEEFT